MSSHPEYLLQADYCKQMANKARTLESRKRWLELSAKWLTLADESYGDGIIQQLRTVASRQG
jgi:hypothetical protein